MFDSANQLLEAGSVGIIPTDTVYGLVARAEDKQAVKRLYSLKDRIDKPGTIIAANIGQLEALGLKHRYLKAVEQFWPGAVSVILPVAAQDLSYLHLSKMSLAVRLPKDERLQALLEKTGALITTSANFPGQPTASNLEQARSYFKDNVDFYVDGGDLSGNQPSTIVRIIDDAVEVVRQGAVKINGE
jgi:L-threonylcarbamoyladenylate synthase